MSGGDKLKQQIEDLHTTFELLQKKSKRLFHAINTDQQLKEKLHKDIRKVSDRLVKVKKRIVQRQEAKRQYQKTITQTDEAYQKIIQSSAQMLEIMHAQEAGAGAGIPDEIQEMLAEMQKEEVDVELGADDKDSDDEGGVKRAPGDVLGGEEGADDAAAAGDDADKGSAGSAADDAGSDKE